MNARFSVASLSGEVAHTATLYQSRLPPDSYGILGPAIHFLRAGSRRA